MLLLRKACEIMEVAGLLMFAFHHLQCCSFILQLYLYDLYVDCEGGLRLHRSPLSPISTGPFCNMTNMSQKQLEAPVSCSFYRRDVSSHSVERSGLSNSITTGSFLVTA